MDTLAAIARIHGISLDQPSPIGLQTGRYHGVPALLRILGYKVGAEIGTLEGYYAQYLLRGIPGLKLYAVDAWTLYPDFDGNDYARERLAQAYELCVARVKGYDCELIRAMSDEAVTRFQDESLDFVFIDANHKYEYVVRDIALWSKKVRKGGIVYGHDFDDHSARADWQNFGVVPAVEGWMKAYKITPWFITLNNHRKCWMYVK